MASSSQASPMLVLVALTGRSLRLDVHSGVRVDAVQQALLSFTGIPLGDQLVMHNGSRLDSARTLGSYGLPVADAGMVEEAPIFLYSRSFLKPGARVPEREALPEIAAAVPPPPAVLQLHHPLNSSPSTLLRGLPQTELQFQHDLAVAKAYWDASQLKVHRCRQLLSEQEVQARAADAARVNVQVHFNHITAAYQKFLTRFSQQHASHAELLASFESDLAQLARTPLHSGLQTRIGCRTLEDLTPVAKMRQWGEHCSRSHEHFGVKVSELGALLQGLKQDVEGLLAQTPTVDLDRLGAELCRAEGAADELSLLVQSLAKDLRAVRELVERAVTELAAPVAGSTVLDASSAMQSMQEAHSSQLLPQAHHLDERTTAFCNKCVDAKSAMTADVVTQLQRISGQQSRIRDLKSKLAAFTEVLTRQEVAFAELKMAQRIPMAYRMMLAECMRQSAWQELYAQQATRLEEHMGKLRAKEASRRTAFLQQVERYLPNEAVAQAGLMQEPPSCSLTVSLQQQPLLTVTAADLQWLPVRGAGIRASSILGLGAGQAPPSAAEMAAEMTYRPLPASSPSLELALLKSELGSHIAAACMRELNADTQAPSTIPASVSSIHASGSSAPAAASGLPRNQASGGGAVGPASLPQSPSGGQGSTAAGAPLPARPWAAPEQPLDSMKRALNLKDDLLDKLQAQVQELSRASDEQQQRLRQMEVQAAADAQALAALRQQQQQLLAQLSAATAVVAEQQQGGLQGLQGPLPLQRSRLQERGLYPSSSSNSLGPSGSSPPEQTGTDLLAPQPMLLGPIALAALSACRPGSAGPLTMRNNMLPPAPVAPRQRSQGADVSEPQTLLGVALPSLSGLTTFSSAPTGAMRPAQRHSLSDLADVTALQQQQAYSSEALQPGCALQPPQLPSTREQQHSQQQQVPHSPEHELQHSGSASGEFVATTGTFSMHDSMPASAMNDAAAPAASSPEDAVPSRSRIYPSSGMPISKGRAAGYMQSATDAPAPFGSLPFASSLPRYGSLANIAAAAGASPPGGSARRPSAGGGSSTSHGLPNAVLASVMRVAGQEPEPLPWAHLRQVTPQPPATTHTELLGAGPSADLMDEGLGGPKAVMGPAVHTGSATEADNSVRGGAQGSVGLERVATADVSQQMQDGHGFAGRSVGSPAPDVADEDAPDLDDILGGDDTSTATANFLTAECD